VLDPTQNKKIRDAYCQDFPFDMSKIFFVLSCNDESKIDKVLKDRLEIVRISGYDVKSKTEIACRHLIPRLIKRYQLDESDFTVDRAGVRRFIEDSHDESYGIRDLNRVLDTLFCKVILSGAISKRSKYYKMLVVPAKRPVTIGYDILSTVETDSM
jgi:ATP-dependent Lon protease